MFNIKNDTEKKVKKYRKRSIKIQDKFTILEKKYDNTTKQITFLENLIKDYKVKVKKLGKTSRDAEKNNQELTEKIMEFIQREHDMMEKNEVLMKRCRKMRSSSRKRKKTKEKSPKIKVWREKSNQKKESPKKKPIERFESIKQQQKKISRFSLSALFGRK